ncbi:MSCRAMM family adhesin SdrC [Mycolicibacterium confluentis]|uniref:MSCRAMM family adhesin SdrC n=1 Tax=Mycolicibacterium confluentis TaxID=28047 RepID=UPI0021F289C4|nr:MSCRAMM family adhesin SdrC [Mycolicibacterium confluentis]
MASDNKSDIKPESESADKAEEQVDSTSESDADTELVDEVDAASDAEADTDEDSETDTESEVESESSPKRRGRVAIVAAAVVLAAALGGAGFLGWKVWDLTSVASAGQQAQDAAVAYAQVLTSIDSNKVDENFNQVLDGATGEFKDMYSQSSVQLRQLLIDNKAAAHGVVVDSAVQSASRDKVVVLLFVDQAVSNTNVPDPRIDRSRIKMTMEDVDGRWRASKVELP